MATIQRFSCDDLLRFASVNFDHLIDTPTIFNYLTYLAKWPDLCHVAVAPGNQFIGYILGATEEQSDGKHWQSLVIEVNVASQYRRQGLATKLVQLFEKQLVDKIPFVFPRDLKYFVCLFVGVDNGPAKKMFEQLGFEVNRSMSDFISDDEDTCEFLYNDFIPDNGVFISGNEEVSLLTNLCANDLYIWGGGGATMSNYWNYYIKWSDFCHVGTSPGELNHGFRMRKALGEEQEAFQFVIHDTSFRVQEPAL